MVDQICEGGVRYMVIKKNVSSPPPSIGPTQVDGPAVAVKFHPPGNPTFGEAILPKGALDIACPPSLLSLVGKTSVSR